MLSTGKKKIFNPNPMYVGTTYISYIFVYFLVNLVTYVLYNQISGNLSSHRSYIDVGLDGTYKDIKK